MADQCCVPPTQYPVNDALEPAEGLEALRHGYAARMAESNRIRLRMQVQRTLKPVLRGNPAHQELQPVDVVGPHRTLDDGGGEVAYGTLAEHRRGHPQRRLQFEVSHVP